ncbi:hypothetical protein SAMN05192559_105299 [Halobacillus karajensis]|uniref:TraB family protein n=1 Tax=Halobacillus karajensis TaxID=195088 RepID=A0A024P6X8_9BACI|nr:DUF5694 domain-containing protein [Halobacillus karajensis]CDQ20439.1 hypothetical protein BN982_02780 [Halobacillus karajensis]CDQ24092.1 hypothetical protein BN983_02357 [Halobacillus karajensis]CDQ27570.1 hypothetical protein BN981_01838 [Halobacillus karajensis]SEH91648.1 hypothetical protein SAMN05192559_105299 [Halobacillus karajensis]
MEKPEILLVGTFHMAMDPEKVNEQQEEILDVVHSLKDYNATKVAVEKSFLIEEELDRKFQEFKKGSLTPAYDEVEQFGFRLAYELELPRIYPVDEIVDMSSPSLNQVFEWAKQHQPELFQEILQVQKKLKTMESNHSVKGILQYVNNPDYIQELQRIYIKLTRVGDRQHQIGVQWLKQWYHRDLAIAANIARITERNDRVLVLIGGDHLHLLQQLLHESGDFQIPSTSKYLPKSY